MRQLEPAGGQLARRGGGDLGSEPDQLNQKSPRGLEGDRNSGKRGGGDLTIQLGAERPHFFFMPTKV